MNKIAEHITPIYNKIVNHYGVGTRGIPSVEVYTSIYSRLSGISGMTGEDEAHAEYDWDNNKIYLYAPAMESKTQLVRSLIHEHVHSLQDHTQKDKNRALGYDKDPFEIQAHKEEENYLKFL